MVMYGKDFFALQVHFAEVAARVTGAPVDRALLDYTNLYVRFGLGRVFDPTHPGWRDYVNGLARAADPAEWTFRFYLSHASRAAHVPTHSATATFGCFSFAMEDAERVRLHFENVDPVSASPLSVERLPLRLRELRSLFEHVRRNHAEATQVVGTSWLHNLRAYRRCFPDEYGASATVA
ncbi:MAG TPA: hypothetical protein VGG24_04705, partial [Paraburkholderia sp.]